MHMLDPDVVICLWHVVDAGVLDRAEFEPACGTLPKECCTESLAMSLRHRHESICSIFDITCFEVWIPATTVIATGVCSQRWVYWGGLIGGA